MQRRDFIKVAGLGSLAVGCSVALAGNHPQRPNIIYILADDLGYAELGCYGQKKIKTPNLDRLAADGVRFTQHYSGSAVCAPSRCMFMTGKHPGHAYVRDNKPHRPVGQIPLPAGEFTLAEMLKSAGYTTGCVGKWGLGFPGSEGDPLNQGFDYFFGYNCQRHAHHYYPTYLRENKEKLEIPKNNVFEGEFYSPDLMRDAAISFIERNQNKPFFLYWPTPVPHVSLEVPQDSLDQYKGLWQEKAYRGGKGRKHGYSGHLSPKAAYAAMITRMDRDVGMVLDRLEELGLADNSLVIFTSDNGTTFTGGVDRRFFDSLGPLRGCKGQLYEGGIRVPFIARWPGRIPAGTTSDHISALWDMMPTFATVAGVDCPPATDGIDMLPAMTGNSKQRKHDFLYWEFPAKHYKGQVAVRMGKWKGIRTRLLKNAEAPLQLYNLEEDIGENHDLASQHPEIVSRINRIIEREHIPSKEFPFKALDRKDNSCE